MTIPLKTRLLIEREANLSLDDIVPFSSRLMVPISWEAIDALTKRWETNPPCFSIAAKLGWDLRRLFGDDASEEFALWSLADMSHEEADAAWKSFDRGRKPSDRLIIDELEKLNSGIPDAELKALERLRDIAEKRRAEREAREEAEFQATLNCEHVECETLPQPATPIPYASNLPMPEPLKVISAGSFATKRAPEREWLVAGLIPAKVVGAIYGDGATGKSLLGLQLLVACVTGRPWLERPVRRGPVIYLCCEDDRDEVHRRLEDICREMSVGMEELEDLHVVVLADEDSVLATSDGRSSVLATTYRYQEVAALVADIRPVLLVGDTLNDIYAASENDRMLAKQFVKAMRRIVVPHGGTALLLAHPSLDGMRSGRGSSGTTGWNNSMRWRGYMDRILAEDGTEPDTTRRVLRAVKANYSAQGGEILLRWNNGCFQVDGLMRGDPLAKQAAADQFFLSALQRHNAQNNYVGLSEKGRYAPRVFAAEGRKHGLSRADLRDAMERLLEAGKIENAPYGQISKGMFRLYPK